MGVSLSLEGVTLHVLDVERSREFYERIPGANLVGHRPGEFAVFQIGDGLIGLLNWKQRGFHVEIGASDLDGVYRDLREAGLEPSSPPRQRPWGERTFNLLDPDGNQLEFQDG